MPGIVESFVGCFQASIATFEERAHIGWDQCIGQPVIGTLAFHIAQIESASRIEIDNGIVIVGSADTCVCCGGFKSNKSHREDACESGNTALEVY